MDELIKLLWIAEPIACLAALGLLLRTGQLRRYATFSAFLSVHVLSVAVLFPLANFYKVLSLNGRTAYILYSDAYWFFYIVECAITFFVIQSLFKLAMEPLKGLRWMGGLAFRWAAFISILVAVASAVAPHVGAMRFFGTAITAITVFQRSESVLILCLLAFLCIAAKPLGLSLRSRIFGVSLGFGMMAMMNMLESAWVTTGSTLFSGFNLIKGTAIVASMLIWVVYFALPEPKRKLITLPIKSPLLVWNDVAEALGCPTPHVALNAGPEMFAEGELEMIRMSMHGVQQQRAS
ncbi:MAG: hypothetical protein ACYCSN_09510 [Acidobacteriaceae bacterium]